jgi:hypothetical protein
MVDFKAKTIGGMFRAGGDEAQRAASAAAKEQLREVFASKPVGA